jgi:hypothetical protein
MRRETILTVRVLWDDFEVDRPGKWDWAIVDPGVRGHVEIVADSDDKRQIDILTENKL